MSIHRIETTEGGKHKVTDKRTGTTLGTYSTREKATEAVQEHHRKVMQTKNANDFTHGSHTLDAHQATKSKPNPTDSDSCRQFRE